MCWGKNVVKYFLMVVMWLVLLNVSFLDNLCYCVVDNMFGWIGIILVFMVFRVFLGLKGCFLLR